MKEQILDLGGVIDSRSLHEYLAKELDFATYYRNNFDDFWSCISDDSLSTMPDKLIIKNFSVLKKWLPNEAAKLESCLNNYQIEYPDRIIEFLD